MRACRDLRKIEGVRNCGSHIGQALLSDEIYGVYFGENWISVDENVDYDDTLASIDRTIEAIPGSTGTADLSAGAHQGGPDRNQRVDRRADLRARAVRHAREGGRDPEAIAGIDGVIDAIPDFAEDLPHVQIELDLAAARRYGLKPGDVRGSRRPCSQARSATCSSAARRMTCTCGASSSARNSLTDVERLPIDTPNRARCA